jgi:hypothetical protein
MENAILTQEALANTGNQVLDVVLTTKSTYCAQNSITLTCMADGKLISFLHVKDICSIFGNALESRLAMVTGCLPPTTKNNKLYHGYGLKSIQAAAEKYGGSMTISSSDNWFRLQVLIPIQEETLAAQ